MSSPNDLIVVFSSNTFEANNSLIRTTGPHKGKSIFSMSTA